MSKTKQTKLANLEAEIVERNIGSTLLGTAKQLVMGEGSLDADIVFVGEAPGKKEDELGRPFVGASGKFLDEMLSSAGMVRDDVYITNIVKYRPPDNRDPSPEEKAEFWPFLLRQIEIINPKVVVTLGRHSGAAFIPDLVISKHHGIAQTVQLSDSEFRVMPLYHPAAAIYNRALRQTLIDDFQQILPLLKTT